MEHVSNNADPVNNLFGQVVLLDPRETCREMLGYDVPWLPTNDNHHILEESPKKDGSGHSFRGTYVDDVADAL